MNPSKLVNEGAHEGHVRDSAARNSVTMGKEVSVGGGTTCSRARGGGQGGNPLLRSATRARTCVINTFAVVS